MAATGTSQDVCAICLGPPKNSVTTPCNHSYCYLCLKTVLFTAAHGFVCPYCRGQLDTSILADPQATESRETELGTHAARHLWLYRARSSGWWLFDTDTMDYLEEKYQQYCADALPGPAFPLRICGIPFEIDLEHMTQKNTQNDAVRKINRVEEGTNLSPLNIRGWCGVTFKAEESH